MLTGCGVKGRYWSNELQLIKKGCPPRLTVPKGIRHRRDYCLSTDARSLLLSRSFFFVNFEGGGAGERGGNPGDGGEKNWALTADASLSSLSRRNSRISLPPSGFSSALPSSIGWIHFAVICRSLKISSSSLPALYFHLSRNNGGVK